MDKINIDLVQFYKREESKIEVVDVDPDTAYFNAYQEPGRYYYSAVLRWDGDIRGEANYAFSLIVER